MEPEELRRVISERRAEQAKRSRVGVPAGVRIGPLTATIMDGARWRDQDEFPSGQLWADEFEKIVSFVQVKGQFEHFLGALRGGPSQRDSAIAELRAAFFFSRNGFPIVAWRPLGAARHEGEFLIRDPSGPAVFVEVKSPGWEGELSDEERAAGRIRQGKYLFCEGRFIAPWERIQFAVAKSYKKFSPSSPNLLLIADDLFVSLQHGTEMQAGTALYSEHAKGYFTDSSFQNLGGVGLFWVNNNGREIWYEMKLFPNPNALPATALPDPLSLAFKAVAKC